MGWPVSSLAGFVAVVDVFAVAAALETVSFGAGDVAVGAWLDCQCWHDVEAVLLWDVLRVEDRSVLWGWMMSRYADRWYRVGPGVSYTLRTGTSMRRPRIVINANRRDWCFNCFPSTGFVIGLASQTLLETSSGKDFHDTA